MDWQIQRLGRVSSVSGDKFEPGDRVVCLIFVGPQGDIDRADMLEAEEADFELLPESVLGRWVRVIKEKGVDAQEQKLTARSVEDLFLSFYSHPSGDLEEVALLKHFIGLLLERRRILKPVGKRQTSGEQTYMHGKTKQEFQVPVLALEPELLMRLHGLFEDLIL